MPKSTHLELAELNVIRSIVLGISDLIKEFIEETSGSNSFIIYFVSTLVWIFLGISHFNPISSSYLIRFALFVIPFLIYFYNIVDISVVVHTGM